MNIDAITELRLENGFRALLYRRPHLPVVATALWYQVGARDERTAESGLSHFLEHMMFKGTGRYAKGEIDLLTSKNGGNNNAFTDHDATVYHFSMASDRWEIALEIEADRMRGCALDPVEFTAEKAVVLEELAMGEDDPWRRLHQGAEALAFDVHPYRMPVIGWREDLQRLTVERMREYYERHYAPDRAILVVAGDFDVDRTVAKVSELFGPLAPSTTPRATALGEPEQAGERRAVQRFPGQLSRLAMTVKTCRIGEDDDLALDVVTQVLGGGRTSRLYRRVVQEARLASDVHVSNESREDPGVFFVSAELQPGASRERTEALVREEFARFVAKGPTASELRRAHTQIDAALQFDEEAVLDCALKLGRFESAVPGGFRTLRDLGARYRAVDARRAREVAARYFAPDRWTTVWSLPTEEPTERGRAAKRPATARASTAKRRAAKPKRAHPKAGRRKAKAKAKKRA